MIRHPPRREPRVLAADCDGLRLAFAVVDPWEIRSSGVSRLRRGHEAAAMRRLIAREKPTAVVLGRALRARVDRLNLSLPLLAEPREKPTMALAAELFCELVVFAPARGALRRVVLLAIAAVLTGGIPSRTYATPRSRPSPPRA